MTLALDNRNWKIWIAALVASLAMFAAAYFAFVAPSSDAPVSASPAIHQAAGTGNGRAGIALTNGNGRGGASAIKAYGIGYDMSGGVRR